MDCLLTEASVRAGGRASVQYIAVLNSVYRRVAMVAAGAASAPEGSPYWHGDMDVGDASDHRIGKVYESIAGVWFIEREYDRILDFLCLIIDIQAPQLDSPPMPERLRGSESLVWGGPLPAALLAFPEFCRLDDADGAMTLVRDGRGREQRLALRYRATDYSRGYGVEIDYMERGRSNGTRRALGTGPPDAAVRPQHHGHPYTPWIPILRALLPHLPPPLPQLVAEPDPGPDSAEPRYFRACPACLVDAEPGDEWIWFGSRGGCGHGMHPPCWMTYVTHCAIGARGNALDARVCLWVQCPTCRRSVTGEIMLDSSGDRPVRVEQLERLATDPSVAIALVPRMPRVSFPGHVNREDGRLLALTDGAGAAGGGGLRAAAPPSRAPAPSEPARRARHPPTTRDDLGGPGYAMARGPAADGARAIYEGGRNDAGSPAATVGNGRGDRGASARRGSNMQEPGRSHDGGSRWPLVREQYAERLTRDGGCDRADGDSQRGPRPRSPPAPLQGDDERGQGGVQLL